MSILNDIKQHAAFRSVWFDRNSLMASLGIDIENRQYIDLSNTPVNELSDLMMKSLMWMETISEILGTAKRMKMNEELSVDTVLNNSLRQVGGDLKATEARAQAKTTQEYLEAQKRLNILSAYTDYLDRLLSTIDKYHYAVKSKIDGMRSMERKY